MATMTVCFGGALNDDVTDRVVMKGSNEDVSKYTGDLIRLSRSFRRLRPPLGRLGSAKLQKESARKFDPLLFYYFCFSGSTPRTPPQGSATSPLQRGIKWTWT